MKGAWRILASLAVMASAGYFVWFALDSIDLAMLEAAASPRVIGGVALAAIIYATIIPTTAWAWGRLLAAQGESWRVSRLAALLAATQLAKYVPGNMAQHASRAALATRDGMAVKTFLSTAAQETVLTAAASVIVGLAMLAISAPGMAGLPPDARMVLMWIGPLLVLAVTVLVSMRVTPAAASCHPNRLVRLLRHVGGLPGAKAAIPALAAYALNYLLVGAGLWVVAGATGMPPAVDLPLVTAAFALSWVIGFLAPGAPAGLGVREGVMMILLSAAADKPQIVVFVLLARMVTMLGDLLDFLVGSAWLASAGKREVEIRE